MRTVRRWVVGSAIGAVLVGLTISIGLASWGDGTGDDAVEVQGNVVLIDTKYEITGTLTALCGDPATCNVYDDEGEGTWILDFGQQGYFLPDSFAEGPHTIQGKLARHGEIDVYVVDGTDVGRSEGEAPPWAPDTDGDGITDDIEALLGTDPLSPDSDTDGLEDGWETSKWGTDPTVIDTDGDGRGDCQEAADVNGDGVVDFVGDAIDYAKAALLPPGEFHGDGDFDINGDGVVDFVGDAIQGAKFALIAGLCQ